MFAVFLGLTIPIYITIVPVFIMMRSVGLTDSLVGLVGPVPGLRHPVRGAGPAVVLPAAARTRSSRRRRSTAPAPGGSSSRSCCRCPRRRLVTVAILDAVSTWNEFLFALILLNSEHTRPIPVGLLNFQGQFANNNTGLAAGILIAVVPILIAYILLQRWIVGGLTAGATKG